jgi:hypothetical protein
MPTRQCRHILVVFAPPGRGRPSHACHVWRVGSGSAMRRSSLDSRVSRPGVAIAVRRRVQRLWAFVEADCRARQHARLFTFDVRRACACAPSRFAPRLPLLVHGCVSNRLYCRVACSRTCIRRVRLGLSSLFTSGQFDRRRSIAALHSRRLETVVGTPRLRTEALTHASKRKCKHNPSPTSYSPRCEVDRDRRRALPATSGGLPQPTLGRPDGVAGLCVHMR